MVSLICSVVLIAKFKPIVNSEAVAFSIRYRLGIKGTSRDEEWSTRAIIAEMVTEASIKQQKNHFPYKLRQVETAFQKNSH